MTQYFAVSFPHNAASSRTHRTMAYFILLLFAMCLQNVVLFQAGGASIKVGHLVCLLALPLFFQPGLKIQLPSRAIIAFFALLVLLSLCNAATWGLDTLFFNYIFNFYLIVTVLTFGFRLTLEQWETVARVSGFLIMLLVWCNCLMHVNVIVQFYQKFWGDGHPVFPLIFGGGPNLEATWPALFGVFFLKRRFGFVYILAAALLSAVLTSRVGLVVCVVYLLWMVLLKRKTMRPSAWLCLLILLAVAGAVFLNSPVAAPIMQRVADIGQDNGSQGRFEMWQYAFKTIYAYPFGCGIGNVMLALQNTAQTAFADQNLHNLYMQMFIELGWLGGLFYAALVVAFVYREIRYGKFANPFSVFLLAFFLLSFLQFRAVEPIVCFMLAVYLLHPQPAAQASQAAFTQRQEGGAIY